MVFLAESWDDPYIAPSTDAVFTTWAAAREYVAADIANLVWESETTADGDPVETAMVARKMPVGPPVYVLVGRVREIELRGEL